MACRGSHCEVHAWGAKRGGSGAASVETRPDETRGLRYVDAGDGRDALESWPTGRVVKGNPCRGGCVWAKSVYPSRIKQTFVRSACLGALFW